MFYPPIFLAGIAVGGLAVYVFYLGRIRELNEELSDAQRND